MNLNELSAVANAMIANGKGILAADESTATITKRLAVIDVESTEDSRRSYRDILFSTDGAAEFISGVIMFDETIRQSASDGTPFAEHLTIQRPACLAAASTQFEKLLYPSFATQS